MAHSIRILLALLLLTSTITPAQTPPIAATDTTGYAQAMMDSINHQREMHALPMMEGDSVLEPAGTQWAMRIAGEQELTHRSQPVLMEQGYGSWTTVGENLARLDVSGDSTLDSKQIMSAFMDSPAHRDNILGPYTSVNIATAAEGPTVYFVLTFIG